MDRKEKLFGFLTHQAKVPLLPDEIALMISVENDTEELLKLLEELTVEGKIIKSKRGRYESAARAGFVSGVFRQNEQGYGFVLNDDGDVYVSEENVGSAMHGDIVLARVQKAARGRTEGFVARVLERAQKSVTGVYSDGKLMPDNRKINKVFKITNPHQSFENQKVAANITDWETPEAEIYLTLGVSGEQNTEMLSIMLNHGIPDGFSDKVLAAADTAADKAVKYDTRHDFRELLTITIDGADARDLDDAISLEEIDGGFRLYVHIADVSEYVTRRGVIDREAQERGTSCYFPDRVSPMLPQALSNGICSLHPEVDRLTLTTVMDFDAEGRTVSHEIHESVIKSDYRMVYEDVTQLLEDEDSPLWRKYEKIRPMLLGMKKLAAILRKNRMASGGVNLDIPEAEIILDEDGKAGDVRVRQHSISHQMIEEFMLACNKTVAEHAFWADLPFVYRVHEEPEEEKAEAFKLFASTLGYKIRGRLSNKKMGELLDEVRGKPEERVISTFLLRSMMKAKYDAQNLGHFGVGAKYYCHFTSPIRRYPDLVCHRIIKASIHGAGTSEFAAFTEIAARSSSEREEAAEQAERDAVRYMMCEYMEKNIGVEFEGIISSVTSFGFFVELDNTIEGLVRVENIRDDYYEFDEKTLSLRGERRKRVFKIGDKVRVLTSAVDRDARWIDFLLVR